MYEINNGPLFSIIISFFSLHVAFVIGHVFLSKIFNNIFDRSFSFVFGMSILMGYGIIGYLMLVLSFFGPLNDILIFSSCILIISFGYRHVYLLYRHFFSLFLSFKHKSLVNKLLFFIIISLFTFYLLSALVPPYRVDALAYHLPESIKISQGKYFSIGGFGDLMGNSPKLIESIFAFAYVLSGFILINLVHYQILLALFLIIYSILKKEFNSLAGLVSIILIFSIYELLVNATNPYVDAATVAFEISAILLFFDYIKYESKDSLFLSGILYGFALSTKYLSYYSLAIIFFFSIIYFTRKREKLKFNIINFAKFGLLIFLFGGFWYIKNLIFFKNPFYPFIFSHNGFSEDVLAQSIYQIKEFIPRNFVNYVLLPVKFFLSTYYLSCFFAFIIFPFSLFIKDNKQIIRLYFYFTILYFTIWFFFISHQKRFGMVGLVMLMIIAGITISYFLQNFKTKVFFKPLVIICILLSFIGLSIIARHKNGYLLNIKKTEISFIFGGYSVAEFYKQREASLGETFVLSQYINKNYSDENFWILWNDANFFIDNKNNFLPASVFLVNNNVINTSTMINYLQDQKINYVVTKTPEALNIFLNNEYANNSVAEKYYKDKVWNRILKINEMLPYLGSVIYNDSGRIIYKINK